MSKTVTIQVEPNQHPRPFAVGEFVIIDHPYKSKRLLPSQLVYWANQMAQKGLIFHSEYDNQFIFRVDGDVLLKLANELSLDVDTKQEYTGGDPLYEKYSSLSLYLDGDVISQVSIP